MLKELILQSVCEAVEIQKSLQEPSSMQFIQKLAELIYDAWENQSKFIIAGNGGSLCDADHFAEELTGFFRSKNRPPIAAVSLSNPSHMSCVGNDIGFDFVFSRAVEALARKGDVLVVLTTSGNSGNLIYAVDSAKKLGIKTVALLGKDGGKLKGKCDLEWIVEGFGFSDRIQEAHMSAIHIAIQAAESMIFQALAPLTVR
ncbi:MAG: SIS domain-containing protein [Verrucomicrobia bacterium]|nr:SIS domain-containing protein [Verrucomicrobiota bacterium]